MNGDVHEGCNQPKFVLVLLFLLMQSPFRFLGSEVIVDDVQDSVPVDSGTNNVGTRPLFHTTLYAYVSFFTFSALGFI